MLHELSESPGDAGVARFALITEQIDWLAALHFEHSALLADVLLLLVRETLQETEVFEVPQRRM